MFTAPSSGVWFPAKELIGHLILVTSVASVEPHYDDMKKATVDKVTFDYTDLDGQQLLITDALDTHPGIVSRIKRFVGEDVLILGRVGQVPTKQPQPAFVLEDATNDPQATARAQAWVAQWRAGNIKAPQSVAPQAVPQPAPQPVQQYVPQPAPVQPQPIQQLAPQPVPQVLTPQPLSPPAPVNNGVPQLPDGVTPQLLQQMSPDAQRQLLQSLGVPAEAVEMLRQMAQ